MKLLKRILLIAVLVFVALGATAYVVVRTAFPPEKIAEIVRTQGSAALGRDVGVESVGIGVFPRLKVAVRGVSLANDSGFSDEPAVSLKSLELAVSWLSLLRFSPEIVSIRLVEPDILFEVDATGRNNLQTLGGTDTTETPEDLADTASALPTLPAGVALRSFVIDDGRVRYRDARSGLTVTLGRIDQRASLSLDAALSDIRTAGTLVISEIGVSDAASGVRTGGVKISVTHDLRVDLPGDSLRVNGVDVAFQDVKAHLEGTLSGFSTPTPTADLHLAAPEISLASLFAEVPAELSPEIARLSVKGTASLDVRVRGVLDTVPEHALDAVSADVAVRDGAFGHDDVPQGIEDFTVDLAVRGDSVHLKTLSFRSGPNPLAVDALVTGALASVPYLRSFNVNGEVDYGNLAGLARALGLLDPAIAVKGRQTFRLTAAGPLDPENPRGLVADGRSELIGFEATVPEFPPLSARGITLVSNESIRPQLTVRVGRSDATVNIVARNYLALLMPDTGARAPRAHVGVEVRSSLVDLDELLPKTGADAPDTSAPLTAWPEWPPLDADVSVALARTRLMNLDMTDFSLKTVLRAASLRTDLKGALYTGTFTSSVSVVPKDSTDWNVGFRLVVDKVEANDFVSRVNDRVPLQNPMLRSLAATDSVLFGKFSLNMDVKTHGLPDSFATHLSGPVTFSVTDGRIVGVEWTKSLSGALAKAHSSLGFEELAFSSLKGDLLIDDGKVLVRDLSFDSPTAGAGHATGTVGFDNKLDLRLAQALPPAASKLAMGAGNALLAGLAKLAPGAGLEEVSLFPKDKQGRALLYYTVEGELSGPRFALDARRMAAESGSAAAKASLEESARRKAADEAAKLEAAARARAAAERKALEEKAAAEKKKLQDKAAAEAKKQGKKLLEGLGK